MPNEKGAGSWCAPAVWQKVRLLWRTQFPLKIDIHDSRYLATIVNTCTQTIFYSFSNKNLKNWQCPSCIVELFTFRQCFASSLHTFLIGPIKFLCAGISGCVERAESGNLFFFKLRLTFQVETKTHTHETGTHFLHLMGFFRFVWIIFIYTSYTKYELVTRAVIVFVKEKKESAMIAPSDVLIYFPVYSIQILDSLAYTEAKKKHTHTHKKRIIYHLA